MENETPQETPQDPAKEIIANQLSQIRADQRRITMNDVHHNVRNTLVKVLETEVSEHDMTKETANRIFDAVSDELGLSWDTLFPSKYEVEVSHNWDFLFRVTVEADDEDDAENQVKENLETNDATVNISCGLSGWSGDVENVDLGWSFDIVDELTFTVTEVE